MHYIDAVIDAMEMTTGNGTANADTLMPDKRHPLNAQTQNLANAHAQESAQPLPQD